MHIAAMSPQYLDRESVPADVVGTARRRVPASGAGGQAAGGRREDRRRQAEQVVRGARACSISRSSRTTRSRRRPHQHRGRRRSARRSRSAASRSSRSERTRRSLESIADPSTRASSSKSPAKRSPGTDTGVDVETTRAMAEADRRRQPGRRLDCRRRRRRQHLARQGPRRGRHGPRDRRLHGHARDGDQRARAAGRARTDGRALARSDGDRDAPDRRTVHPPPRDPSPGKRPRRDLCGRHRQPVLHDRHDGGAARGRDRARKRSSKPPRSTASTAPIRRRIRRRRVSSTSTTWKYCSADSKSWTRRR